MVAVVLAVIFISGTLCTYYYQKIYTSKIANDELQLEKVFLGEACALKDDGKDIDNATCKAAIILAGSIGEGMFEAFENFLLENKEHPNLVCFMSNGGELNGAEKIANKIRGEGLDTCMSDRIKVTGKDLSSKIASNCESACPFVLLAGSNRVAIGSDFKITVHHPGSTTSFCICDIKFNKDGFTDSENVYTRIIQASAEDVRDSHMDFYRRAMSTPFYEDSLDLIKYEEFKKYKLFTSYL